MSIANVSEMRPRPVNAKCLSLTIANNPARELFDGSGTSNLKLVNHLEKLISDASSNGIDME